MESDSKYQIAVYSYSLIKIDLGNNASKLLLTGNLVN